MFRQYGVVFQTLYVLVPRLCIICVGGTPWLFSFWIILFLPLWLVRFLEFHPANISLCQYCHKWVEFINSPRSWFEPGIFLTAFVCSVVDRKMKRALRSLHLIWSFRSIDVLTVFPRPSIRNIFCFTTRASFGLALVLVVRCTPKSYHVRCCFSLNIAQSHVPVLVANLNPNNWLLFNQEQEQPSKLWPSTISISSSVSIRPAFGLFLCTFFVCSFCFATSFSELLSCHDCWWIVFLS